MNRPLIALAGLIVAGGTAGGALIIASSGGEEEAVQQVETATATAAVSGTASPSPAPTSAPSPNPTDTAAPTSTPSVPEDWPTYSDPVLGFSLRYPLDLTPMDLTEGGFVRGQRIIAFRSPTDQSRGFAISVNDSPKGVTLEQWAVEFGACRPDTIQPATLGGVQAILCTREALEGYPSPSIQAEHRGMIFLISGLTEAEFTQLISSFRF